MYDVIIIGAGPAGITSAIYTIRAGLKVLVLYSGLSNVEKANKIENYYGFKNGITGRELFNNGIAQAKNLGVDILQKEVVGIEQKDNKYCIKTLYENFDSKYVIIATSNKKETINVTGINKYEGKGISYCAICDAFFYKNKNVAIIGNGEYAYDEAQILSSVTNSTIILTNGLKQKFNANDIKVNKKKIKEVKGKEFVTQIIFEDHSTINIDGIFIALGEAGAIDFARTLGIYTEGQNIKVNKDTMETNVKGIYAVGNITGGIQQISKAVYEGTVAAISIINKEKGTK